jgi:hypothetical protein
MPRAVRSLMIFEAATFLMAAAIHAGFFVDGYAHREARIAETIIAAVLLAGAALASFPRLARRAALAAQGFALALTFVGIGTIIAGIGPRSFADVLYHVAIVVVLIYGLVMAAGSSAAQHRG